MPASVTSPADVVNLTLSRIGYTQRVGNLYEGSAASKAALDVYAQTRDGCLRDGDWPFASRTLAAVLLKSAPIGGYIPPNSWSTAYPAQPWSYEYEYPSDCLKVRACKPLILFVPNFAPRPYTFAISNDNGYSPARRVVLSNVENALLIYTGQVTDPATWPPDFVETLATELGKVLGPSLMKSLEVAKLEASDEQMQKAQADVQQG